MDTLFVSTQDAGDEFVTTWRWQPNTATVPSIGGTIDVTLGERYTEDRRILAELGAIHHLLSVEQVNGQNRLGNGLAIEVSSGAIRKAVAKGALKKNDSGRTDKQHVAHFAHFLATKFFEAEVKVGKLPAGEPKTTRHFAITLDAPPVARMDSPLGPVIVSRHALNRFVERFAAEDLIKAGMDIIDAPDHKWTQAWRNLGNLLPKSERVAKMPEQEWRRIARKYGAGTIVLHHADSRNLFILKKEPYGLVMATARRRNLESDRIVPPLPKYVGGRLVHQAA